MEALASLPLEIQTTIAATLIVALISILQVLDLQRAKKESGQKIQELSKALARGGSISGIKKYRAISPFSLTIQFIFGFIVFAFLSCWTVFLIQSGYIGSAVGSGIFALVGISMPFYIWLSAKRISKEREQLIKDFESRPKPPEAPKKSFETEPKRKAPEQIPEVQKASAVAEKRPSPVTEKTPVAEKKPEPVAKPAAPEARKKAEYSEGVPEDSMLRRHYVSHMASLKQQAAFQVKAAEVQAKPAAASATKPEVLTAPKVCSKKMIAPQDSMLRRHYLATLRCQIESGLPPRPTDSILKRHYDGWKNDMIEHQIVNCLKESGV
ncbi:MAG: hypothetical protein ACU83O_11990 [Gammaproteobacteria bacterium]